MRSLNTLLLDALLNSQQPARPITYRIETWQDKHGRWFAHIGFSAPIAQSDASRAFIEAAMNAAKRRIRRDVNASTAGMKVPALRYCLVAKDEHPRGALHGVTIAERFE